MWPKNGVYYHTKVSQLYYIYQLPQYYKLGVQTKYYTSAAPSSANTHIEQKLQLQNQSEAFPIIGTDGKHLNIAREPTGTKSVVHMRVCVWFPNKEISASVTVSSHCIILVSTPLPQGSCTADHIVSHQYANKDVTSGTIPGLDTN